MGDTITIAAYGDSLFDGWGLELGQDAPTALERLLTERGRNVTMLNFGVSGETADDALRRLSRVRAARPDLALVEFGANEFYQGMVPSLMEQNLETIVAALMEDGCRVILVGIRCLEKYTGAEYASWFAPVHARVAEKLAVPLIPDILAAYLHRPELLLPDGIHPNAAGAEAIAEHLLPQVEAVLDEMTGSE